MEPLSPIDATRTHDAQYDAKDATSRAVHFTLPYTLTQPALASCQPGKRCDAGESVRREFDTRQPQSRAFCVDGLLSPGECDALIEATERIGAVPSFFSFFIFLLLLFSFFFLYISSFFLVPDCNFLGYDSVDDIRMEYPKDYRNNQRYH
jgi:hypothetical protein